MIFFSKKNICLWLLRIFAIFILFIFIRRVAYAQIIINEIGAFEKTDSEWIEVFNTGDAPIDMTGWKFYEDGINHHLSVFQGDFIIDQGEYAVISQKADVFLLEKSFSGTIFDSSWSNLKESGEEIGLKDSQGNIVEVFTYVSVADYSLERADPKKADYSGNNWWQHMSGHTAGMQNSNYLLSSSRDITTATPQESPPPPSTQNKGQPPPPPDVVINELLPDPRDGEEEWIELYNKSLYEGNLDGWYIEEGSETKTLLQGVIGALGFMVIPKPKGSLNNEGDIIFLKDANGKIIDQVTYGAWQDQDTSDNAPKVQDSNSIARIPDGNNSGYNDKDFMVTQSPTPGRPNIISQDNVSKKLTSYSKKIIINEIYPYPAEAQEDEFIELKNIDDKTMNLIGWQIGDSTTRKYIFESAEIEGKSLLVLYRKKSGIVLNNLEKDKVVLYGPDGQVVDEILYEGIIPRGQTYNRGMDGSWFWSMKITPDKENIILQQNQPPVAVMSAPLEAGIDEVVFFDGSDSYDPENSPLSYFLDFGDKTYSIDKAPQHTYFLAGRYQVVLKVFDNHNASSTQARMIRIVSGENYKDQNLQESTHVLIRELLPNPEGSDTQGEYIKLYNPNDFDQDISGWSLQDARSEYRIPQDTSIKEKSFLSFNRQQTHLTLDNKGDHILLLDDLGNTIDELEYEEVSEGEVVFKNEDGNIDEKAAVLNSENASKQKSGRKTLSKNFIEVQSLSEIGDIEIGTDVRSTGSVLVEPGVLGSQIFYIGDEEGGVQVYMFKKDWPKLKVGQRIEVEGVISISRGEKRIRLKDREDIIILEQDNMLSPETISLTDLDLIGAGRLMNVVGEVTEDKGSGFYIDDQLGELYVYLKKTAGISKNWKAGDNLSVTGILVQTQDGLRLLPRYQEDIKIMNSMADQDAKGAIKNIDSERLNTPTNNLQRYILAAFILFGGLTAYYLLGLKRNLP